MTNKSFRPTVFQSLYSKKESNSVLYISLYSAKFDS